jgi:hypothetical protein
LLDANRMLSMQEDVHSHCISTQVMKHRLYESVVTSPRHRRLSHSVAIGNEYNPFQRMVFSMPVTPAHSGNASPTGSPTSTSKGRHFRFGSSRGGTPRAMSPERGGGSENGRHDNNGAIMNEEEVGCHGLASIFWPMPKVIRATDGSCDDVQMEDDPRGGDVADEGLATMASSTAADYFSLQTHQEQLTTSSSVQYRGNLFKRPLPVVRDSRQVKHRSGLF